MWLISYKLTQLAALPVQFICWWAKLNIKSINMHFLHAKAMLRWNKYLHNLIFRFEESVTRRKQNQKPRRNNRACFQKYWSKRCCLKSAWLRQVPDELKDRALFWQEGKHISLNLTIPLLKLSFQIFLMPSTWHWINKIMTFYGTSVT